MTATMRSLTFEYVGEIAAKPRMTNRDRWLDPPRPSVAKWRRFKDAFRIAAIERGYKPALHEIRTLAATVFLPIPKSYSKKKKSELAGSPHLKRPDASNILKGLEDALTDDDSGIYFEAIGKYYVHLDQEPSILITIKVVERDDFYAS